MREHLFGKFRVQLLRALRADAVAEFRLGMLLDVAFDPVPVPLVVTDLVAL